MPDPITESAVLSASLRVGYERIAAADLLRQPDVLAVFGFGGAAAGDADPRMVQVGLDALQPAPFEVWRTRTPVRSGRSGELRWSDDGDHLFFAIEVDEAAHGGIAAAAEYAYRSVTGFVAAGAMPHVLRLWNYFDAINLGAGDDERYRQFCDGRARGMLANAQMRYPAATAIGRQDGVRVLQVYGLAARHAGRPVENPRQVSAWRYPRQYGPTAPTFARGMLTATSQLLISGTAAVVGHASRHHEDLAAQIDETLANLEALVRGSGCGHGIGAYSCLKAYVRHAADAAFVATTLRARLPAPAEVLLLAGDICRSELLVEIDGVHQPPD